MGDEDKDVAKGYKDEDKGDEDAYKDRISMRIMRWG